MAFISELNFKTTGGAAGGEYVEIVLGPGEDPADFVVSIYDHNGLLLPTAGIAGGEVTLSSLTGVPDPDSPAFMVYTIPVGFRNGAATATEGSGIALTDTSGGGGVIDFYSAFDLAAFTATEGAASGATSDNIVDHRTINSSESYQWDIFGNFIPGPISNNDAVLCVCDRTLLRGASGQVRAADLRVGDLVWTLDHGPQPVRWIGKTDTGAAAQHRAPGLQPVRIRRGALGNGTPTRDLLVSPQHRILGRSRQAERMFGTAETLLAATRLVGLDGIRRAELPRALTYVHLLFDRHEIIEANGALVESLLLADQSRARLAALRRTAPDRLLQALLDGAGASTPARDIAEGRAARRLVQRLKRNGKPYLDAELPHGVCSYAA